ncbi:MAG: hypothetical protein WAX77_08845 [Methylococcaceae bacterium]
MAENKELNIMELIYNKINDMIGAGNQLFSMQFPAQPLNYRLYQYDTSDRNSILTRPYSVAEQEFRLSDQLFDVSPITAGSNGEKLSIVYDTLINNLIPKIDYLAPFIKDRAGLGTFLQQDSGEQDEQGNSMSRIELCKKLYLEYLEAKNAWNEKKNKTFDDFKEKPNGLDDYAKWQSSVAVVEQEKLNNLYNDVVVRGLLHEVLTILGYLNASSIAEQLELSKQRMRNSARISLDESMTVYPVQFQPNNWFKALSPNLNPEDLTMAKESIRDVFIAKQRELAQATTELQQLMLLAVDSRDIETLNNDIAAKKIELNKSESDLIKQYGEGVVGIAKIYFNVMNVRGTVGAVIPAKAKKLGAIDDSSAYMEALGHAVEGVATTYNKQVALNQSLANLSDLQAKKAQLESRDWQFNKLSLEQRVNALQTEVGYYSGLLSGVFRESGKTTRIELERKSYANGTLIYEIGIAPTVTGGSFTLKIGDKPTDSIAVASVSLENHEVIDYAKLKTDISDAVNKCINEKEEATIDEVSGSKGYWTLTIKGLEKEPNVFAIEDTLKPIVEIKEPSLLSTPLTAEEAEINGMFQDIVITNNESSQTANNTSTTSANTAKWGVSAWFASVGGQHSSSSASTAQSSSFFNQEIEIGFRVAKVSFDRGGWFNPQLFKMSHAFYKLADLRIADGLTVEQIRETIASKGSLEKLVQYPPEKAIKEGKYILPAFPVAMAIAKDITIKVKMTETSSSAAKSVMENASATSGGFLCFSVGSSSSNKNSSESALHGAHGEYYYIRIPGPQVLGYFLQFVPKDNTAPYVPLTDASGNSPVLDAFHLYDNPHQISRDEGRRTLDSQEDAISALLTKGFDPNRNPLIIPEDTDE